MVKKHTCAKEKKDYRPWQRRVRTRSQSVQKNGADQDTLPMPATKEATAGANFGFGLQSPDDELTNLLMQSLAKRTVTAEK